MEDVTTPESFADLKVIGRIRVAAKIASSISFGIAVGIVLFYYGRFPFRMGVRTLPTILTLFAAGAIFVLNRSTELSKNAALLLRLIGIVVFFFSCLTLIEYATGFPVGINLPYLPLDGESATGIVSKLPPNSALAFTLLGLSITLQTFGNRFVLAAQAASMIAAAVGILAVMGYVYGVGHLYAVAGLTAMSFPGSISFTCLAFAAFVASPTVGMMQYVTSSRAGGVMARRLFLADLAIPPLLGVIALVGYNQRLYDTPFGISLVVILAMITYVLFTSVLVTRLESSDTERLAAEGELGRSREELRDLSRHVQAAQEEERIRIAREIHDELGQSLTALKMDVSLLRKAAAAEDASSERWDGVLSLVDSTIRSVQRISTELRPGVLDDLGLTAAIEWQTQQFQRRTGIRCTLTVTPPEVLADQLTSTALFRIVQETLTNVARHAEAQRVSIQLSRSDHTLVLRISDDGKGISEHSLTRSESLGLIGMRERAHLLRGTLEIRGIPNSGTTVEVKLPILEEIA